jgi:hypothetical protein
MRVMLKRVLKVLGAGVILWGLTLPLPGADIAVLLVVQAVLALVLSILLAVLLLFRSSRPVATAECRACPIEGTP